MPDAKQKHNWNITIIITLLTLILGVFGTWAVHATTISRQVSHQIDEECEWIKDRSQVMRHLANMDSSLALMVAFQRGQELSELIDDAVERGRQAALKEIAARP